MNSSQLPINAFYTPEGAIAFVKTNKTKQVEALTDKVNTLEEELAEMRKLMQELKDERLK